MNLLFTYGILKHDGDLIAENYKIDASMFHLGGYPAITELNTGRQAIGNIIAIDDNTLKHFDIIEGVDHKTPSNGLYRRETIGTDRGPCFIYIYNGAVENCPPISIFNPSNPVLLWSEYND